ncbi:MAG: hypothetical protein ACOX7X_03530 [Methanosarcina flavescens]|jgi:hypothetical protein|uniref:Uncharacterized protein n=1 Tax=Methanosarcina flavescens TaxID=1715806 RepID=A0A660HRT5_9EURY|nr:hypothetical protein [Methanosarcina flavescens]AYK14968.1 hypothetical protein AOB57_006935 [Methanosarcina flavescens]NLK32525.1 hypothetical protein [Methanosarcina flavescens]
MVYMRSALNKAPEVVGVLFGLVLFYFWLIFIDKIKMLFFSEAVLVDGNKIIKAQYWGQIDQWLVAGLILFFLIFGHYSLCSKNMSRIEKNRDIIGMKSALIGFVLWLFITIISFLFNITVTYSFNIVGGYITIIFVYFLMRKSYI